MRERNRLLQLDQDQEASETLFRMRVLANRASEDVGLIATEECADALTTMLIHHGISRTSKYKAASCILSAVQRAVVENPEGLAQFQVFKKCMYFHPNHFEARNGSIILATP